MSQMSEFLCTFSWFTFVTFWLEMEKKWEGKRKRKERKISPKTGFQQNKSSPSGTLAWRKRYREIVRCLMIKLRGEGERKKKKSVISLAGKYQSIWRGLKIPQNTRMYLKAPASYLMMTENNISTWLRPDPLNYNQIWAILI